MSITESDGLEWEIGWYFGVGEGERTTVILIAIEKVSDWVWICAMQRDKLELIAKWFTVISLS